ncbi:MAG: MauE/DoxX family redox-associated membrane protein [Xanthomonadales bacterium]|nr:MauE/DoxX family redox-associated membrane protein [Xanthomonadales bacterium]
MITISISVCMSLLFGMAAVHKLRAPAVFRSAMDQYRLLPTRWSGLAAVLLAAAEALAALLVLVPGTRAAGFAAMAALLLVYTAGIAINLYRGRRDIDCGCSGPASRQPLSGWLVLRNLALLGLVALAGQAGTARALNWLDGLVILFTVLIAGGLYLGMNQLLAQAPRMARLRSGA